MAIGLFGKLPQKADFVTLNLPSAILRPMEQWLEAGVAESQALLGEAWLDAYLVAPIWRLWIGQGVFGQGCCGALMPSVDAVGRYFPLLMLAWSADGTAPAGPGDDAGETWYGEVERRLLSALSDDAAISAAGLIADLAEPAGATGRDGTDRQSCWWHAGAETIAHAGLPPPRFYAELIGARESV